MQTEVDIQINEKYLPYLHNESRYLVLWGGGGSGKSVFAAQKILIRCLYDHKAKHRFLCLRKVKTTIRDSIFKLLLDLIGEMGIAHKVSSNKTEMSFAFENGNEIITAGVDDPEKLKSIAGITGIWIEEPTELEELEFDKIDLRLRGETVSYKQIILSFNPIDELHWLKKKFFESVSTDVTTLHSTYLDNAFIDEDYKRLLEERVSHDENLYRVFVKGIWGRVKLGGEFYTSFKRSQHIAKVDFEPGKLCHLSFDFNVWPYMSLLCAQVIRTDRMFEIRFFKEYALKNPFNTVEAVCKAFIADYGKHRPVVNYYGDATGKNRIAGQGDKRNFDDVERYLFPCLHNGSDAVLRRNPNVLKRRDFINKILSGGLNIRIIIDPSCTELIQDLDYLKLGIEGKHKEMYHDKSLGVSYQKLGHLSDCLDYMIVSLFENEFKGY